jgi:hypothetical protein
MSELLIVFLFLVAVRATLWPKPYRHRLYSTPCRECKPTPPPAPPRKRSA